MGFKDLFIQKEAVVGENTPTETKVVANNSPFNIFGGTQEVQISKTSVSSDHLDKARGVYKTGFDSLNQQGYDFYEFYTAVLQAGVDNPQIYNMAFTMGNAMDKSITREKLTQQGDYYINEIQKVYNDFNIKGTSKKEELVQQKTNEKQTLSSELDTIRQQIESLKLQQQDRENKLNTIDSKYTDAIGEIDSKISANNIAKDELVNSLSRVKNGIINFIK